MLGVALVFSARTGSAERHLAQSPWRTLLIGLVVMGGGGFLSVALMASPLPGPKFAGFVGSLALLCVAIVGMGGLAALFGKRIQPLEPSLSSFRALSRGAGLIVAATLLPLVGWFVFTPLVLIYGAGAGVQALFSSAGGASSAPPSPAFDLGAPA